MYVYYYVYSCYSKAIHNETKNKISTTFFENLGIVFQVLVQWLAFGTHTRTIRVRFPSDWLLDHGDNRGRHSANHNLLPDMYLRVKRVMTVGLFMMSGRVTGKL